MIKFISLVQIVESRYWLWTDNQMDIISLHNELKTDVNSRLLIHVESGGAIEYLIDFSQLATNIVIPSTVTTIDDLLTTFITPEMLYSYQVSNFNFKKFVRCINGDDIPGDLIIKRHNNTTDESATIPDDPNYPDLMIDSATYDLTNAIPLISGKLRLCYWADGKVFVDNAARLADSLDTPSFVSFAEVGTVELKPLSQLQSEDWDIAEDVTPILVLNGSMYFDDPDFFTQNKSNNKLILNPEISSVAIDDVNSFVILIPCNSIHMRESEIIHIGDQIYQFDEPSGFNNHLNYICLGRLTNTVIPFTIIEEKYRNVSLGENPSQHHLYVGNNGNPMRLVQIVVC